MRMRLFIYGTLAVVLASAWFGFAGPVAGKDIKVTDPKKEEEWRKKLGESEFCVLRQKGTERAFTGKYWNSHEKGTYICKGCGKALFRSDSKYDSGSGWPSFFTPIDSGQLSFVTDTSMGMTRIEVNCRHCGGHLGHVFDDGPQPTGKRYCINSLSLDFVPDPK